MNGHHLILGKLKDFLTGKTLDDTHDERYRQNLARFLVREMGYHKGEVESRHALEVRADQKKAIVFVDFTINLEDRVCMIVKYGPGSLVTRHRPALAVSRLITGYQIPIVVVTNGVDADILEGADGKKVSAGLTHIPPRNKMVEIFDTFVFTPLSNRRQEAESRIVYCYEVDGSCPCDETICRL